MPEPQIERPPVTNILPTTVLPLQVCGVSELADELAKGASHLVSITDPDVALGVDVDMLDADHRLHLSFHDVIRATVHLSAAGEADMARVLAFGAGIAAASAPPSRIVVHCTAGVSRSSAVTMVLLAQAGGVAAVEDLLAVMRDEGRIFWPNLRLIALGDRALGLEGALIDAILAHYRAAGAEDALLLEALMPDYMSFLEAFRADPTLKSVDVQPAD